MGRDVQFEPDALDRLHFWSWPGNFRELSALASRLAMLDLNLIKLRHLPSVFHPSSIAPQAMDLRAELLRQETQYLEWAMHVANGNQSQAATLLGLTRSSLQRRLQQLRDRRRQEKRLRAQEEEQF